MSVRTAKMLANATLDAMVTGSKSSIIRRQSFRRFCEDHLTIIDKDRKETSLIPNWMQRAYWQVRKAAIDHGHNRILLVKPRQEGFTTLESADSYQRVTQARFENCVELGHTDEATSRIFQIVHRFAEYDPFPPAGMQWTRRSLSCARTGGQLYIGTAGSKSFGRSATLTKVHGTEVCFWDGNVEKRENLIAGLTEAAGRGLVVFETSPRPDEWFYPTWQDARKSDNEWVPIFLGWWMNPSNKLNITKEQEAEIIETLDDEEVYLVGRYHLTTEQLAWRRSKHKALRKLAYQEYPDEDSTAFLARGLCYFDRDILKQRKSEWVKDPLEKTEYRTVYEKPMDGMSYIIGVDVAEGKDEGKGDWSAAVVMDSRGAIVCIEHAKLAPPHWAERIDKLGREYNMAMLVVEKNNHGHLVIDRLRSIHYYPKLYRTLKWNGRKWAATKEFGFLTTGLTRDLMLSDLDTALNDDTMFMPDGRFFNECNTFIQKNGRYEGVPHDDIIIATALCIMGAKVSQTANVY